MIWAWRWSRAARLTASIETRSSDFDEQAFTADGEDLGLTGVTSASGVAACSIDSFGYGLGLSVVRSNISFYASGTLYDYSSYECNSTITSTTSGSGTTPADPTGRAPIVVTRPSVVTQMASTAISGISGYSSTRAPHEGTLLESSLMLGASFSLGDRRALGFELYRASEEFAQSDTTTALAYLAWPLTQSISMDVTVGTNKTDLLDDSVFAGLRLSASVGR